MAVRLISTLTTGDAGPVVLIRAASRDASKRRPSPASPSDWRCWEGGRASGSEGGKELGRQGGREVERVWQTKKSQYSTYFYRLQRLCSMWEPNVGVQRPKLLYLSPRGAPQKVAKALLKNESERTEGGCLSCVGRLTYASGDLASFFSPFRYKPLSMTLRSHLSWLVCDVQPRLPAESHYRRQDLLVFFIISIHLSPLKLFCASNATRLLLAVIERICCLWPCFSLNHMPRLPLNTPLVYATLCKAFSLYINNSVHFLLEN